MGDEYIKWKGPVSFLETSLVLDLSEIIIDGSIYVVGKELRYSLTVVTIS